MRADRSTFHSLWARSVSTLAASASAANPAHPARFGPVGGDDTETERLNDTMSGSC